jgi:tetratricopeptide (TPR) repeat protein
MQAAVQQYATEVQRTYGVPLQMRVGLNAGAVVVRAIGNDLHMDYSAIGQTTHLAARMEQMAMPGTILLTPAVVDLANGFIQVTPIGPVSIKGLDAPVEVFELVGATGLAALEHLPDSRAATEQAIDLQLVLRPVRNALGETPARMLDHLRRAEALAEMLGDPLRLGRIYNVIGSNFWDAGEVDHAIDYSQRALALAATLGHVSLQAQAQYVLGCAYYDAGDYARAVESLERSVMTLQGDRPADCAGAMNRVAASSRSWLSRCYAERGTFTEGLAMAADGLRIAEAINHPFRLIDACRAVGVVHLRQGEVPRAVPLLERAVRLCQDWQIPVLWPIMAANLGLAYALDRRVAAGLELVERGVEQAVAGGRPRILVHTVVPLSEAYLLAGRLDEARQRAAQALDLARQYQQRGNQAWALWLLGESTARQASLEREPAAGHYRQALALAEELGMRPLQAHCHRGLGMLYATVGQQESARTALPRAITMYRGMGMTFWLPQTEAALAQVEA